MSISINRIQRSLSKNIYRNYAIISFYISNNYINLMKNQFLTYGSIISISHVSDSNSFITSDGFVKRSVMLRNFVHNTIIYLILQHNIDLEDLNKNPDMKSRTYFNTLFQIFPKFSNTVKFEILKEFELPGEDDDPKTN